MRAREALEAGSVLLGLSLIKGALPPKAISVLVRRASAEQPLSSGTVDAALVERVAQSVQYLGARMPRSTCLTRALTAWLMLRRRNVPSVLRLGATRDDRLEWRMHAWLVCGGVTIIGHEEADSFTPLARAS